jgi:HAD superfamily hydrolase (TIGR01509 family)
VLTPPGIEALLFDFDGTIWDSEAAVFNAYRRLYEEHGHELPVDRWTSGVGTLDGYDPAGELETLIGRELDDAASDPWASLDHVDLRPGVRAYLDRASDRGIALGIVSSNSGEWVRRHLLRLGIADGWHAIVTADGDASIAKPNPVLYREALTRLGAGPASAIAIEDSPNGIAAAKAAGIFCLAVPNEVTERLDVSAADVVVRSLEELPLDDLIALAERRAPG